MKPVRIKLTAIEPWAPHPKAAQKTERRSGKFVIAANGTRTSCGGWQLKITGLKPSLCYQIELPYQIAGVENPREHVKCLAIWGDVPSDQSNIHDKAVNDALIMRESSATTGVFSRVVAVPPDATILTLRYILRWTPRGTATLGAPVVTETTPILRPIVRIAVATGSIQRRNRAGISSVKDNIAYYSTLCEEAARLKPDFIVLPETALQWGAPGHAIDTALQINGPEVNVFRKIASANKLRILLPIYERDADAVFNSALLVGPRSIEGCYRKVQLAEYGETNSGIMPGSSFPVFDTPTGRVGCLICMDSSCQEASRMLGLNGAEIMLLPIMGDHRADRFTRGVPVFHEERWKAIMRSRALDNQFVLGVARNETLGSCVIDRKGEIRAWNDGTEDVICADVELNPDHRKWNGGSQRDIIWLQRRPSLYGAYTEPVPPVIATLH